MQGLGTGADLPLRKRRAGAAVPAPRHSGRRIAAFALSEPDAGSDVAAITTRARREGGDWVLDGTKTWISNGGIADHYVVFARTGEDKGDWVRSWSRPAMPG